MCMDMIMEERLPKITCMCMHSDMGGGVAKILCISWMVEQN